MTRANATASRADFLTEQRERLVADLDFDGDLDPEQQLHGRPLAAVSKEYRAVLAEMASSAIGTLEVDDRRADLEFLCEHLRKDLIQVAGVDLAAVSRELRAAVVEMDALADPEVSRSDELAAKRAERLARLTAAEVRVPAAGGRRRGGPGGGRAR